MADTRRKTETQHQEGEERSALSGVLPYFLMIQALQKSIMFQE